MDFNDSPEEAAWRAECRAWLEEHAPTVAGNGVGALGDGWQPTTSRAQQWQAMKFEAGLTKIAWEPEFGGRNGTAMQQVIFGQEEAKFDVPGDAFVIGLGMIAPTFARAAPTSNGTATSRSCCAARRSGASCSASPVPVPTSRRCRPWRCATATSG